MVNHPVRRRIVMSLMLVGSAGLVTVVASLMLSFTGAGHRQTLHRVLLLIAGVDRRVAAGPQPTLVCTPGACPSRAASRSAPRPARPA